MPLKQITFSKKYPYAQFLNYDIGYVWELSDGETNEEIEEKLLQMAENHHRTHHPHIYKEQDTTYTFNTNNGEIKLNDDFFNETPNHPITQEQKFLNLINLATSTKELSMYEKTANNPKYPNLKEAYNKKYEQLTNTTK